MAWIILCRKNDKRIAFKSERDRIVGGKHEPGLTKVIIDGVEYEVKESRGMIRRLLKEG
jgi:hypothetical protein